MQKLITLIASFLFFGCAQAADVTPDNTEPPTVVEVEILKYTFTPQHLTIKPGTTVRWINREKRQYHSVWFEDAGYPEPDYFFPGETFELTFTEPGTLAYRCGPHPQMTGTVTVSK